MKVVFFLVIAAVCCAGCAAGRGDFLPCTDDALGGIRKIADGRSERFSGKVAEETARCRGGETAVSFRNTPWVDWQNYWGAGDSASGGTGDTAGLNANTRGILGALLDLEYQRIELIKFNLFDNSGTYSKYHTGALGGRSVEGVGRDAASPRQSAVRSGGRQRAAPALPGRPDPLSNADRDLQRHQESVDGLHRAAVCAQRRIRDQFPGSGLNELTRNRHGDRIGLLKPDPQVISRHLFTRLQAQPEKCRRATACRMRRNAECDYKKAPVFNVLAAFWIQFMTHDWFSHLEEGRNDSRVMIRMGCATELVNNSKRR